MSSTMLLGTSGIIAYQDTEIATEFISNWMAAFTHVFPYAILLLLIVAPLINTFVAKVLLQPESSY